MNDPEKTRAATTEAMEIAAQMFLRHDIAVMASYAKMLELTIAAAEAQPGGIFTRANESRGAGKSDTTPGSSEPGISGGDWIDIFERMLDAMREPIKDQKELFFKIIWLLKCDCTCPCESKAKN